MSVAANLRASASFSDSKQHYHLLDGLRGVAALMVIVYHCFECFPPDTWIIGHGYLAVDFFFILSGFVIGYAYDDRWKSTGEKRLTTGNFFKRRLIRLHPMVLFGIIWGTVTFLVQGGIRWDGSHVAISAVMIAMLLHLFFIPEIPGGFGEVRGNGEMFPLNGPHWSLFFEYIGNILDALFFRRIDRKWLAIVTFAIILPVYLALFLTDTVGYGNIGVGWTLADMNFWGGLLRMLLPFMTGIVISRYFKPMAIRGAFWKCSLLVVVFLSLPAFGGERVWINCLFEAACVIFVFPLIVYMAASGTTSTETSTLICKFLGDISYPLYAIHYPTMYLFYHYIGFPATWRTPGETWPLMVLLVVGNVAMAYIVWKFYDEPLRKWLTKKFVKKIA